MNTTAYRELKVLEELSSNSTMTQRHLARKLEVALGLTNLMIRRLAKKGYVKVVNVQRNRIHYLITPKGLSEKTRLTYEYLEYSLHLYRAVRQILKETLGRLAISGGRRVVFFGTGEIAEIAYLTLKELPLQLVGVVDDDAVGDTFLELPVLSTSDLSRLTFDCVVVSSVNNGLNGLFWKRLEECGVPKSKIVIIEQRGPNIRAVLPDVDRTSAK